MNSTEKTLIAVTAVIAVIAVIAFAATMASFDNRDEQWEDRAQDAIEDEGYTEVVITSCTYFTMDETMSVSGSFTSHGQLYTYFITFVNENGSWKAYDTSVH